MPEPALHPLADGVRVRIRVTPRARADAIGGTGEDAGGVHLKVRVTAVPAEGQANERIVRLIAAAAAVSPSAVRMASGATARVKSLIVTGPCQAVLERLQKVMGDPR